MSSPYSHGRAVNSVGDVLDRCLLWLRESVARKAEDRLWFPLTQNLGMRARGCCEQTSFHLFPRLQFLSVAPGSACVWMCTRLKVCVRCTRAIVHSFMACVLCSCAYAPPWARADLTDSDREGVAAQSRGGGGALPRNAGGAGKNGSSW